jgi:hypothetical protein
MTKKAILVDESIIWERYVNDFIISLVIARLKKLRGKKVTIRIKEIKNG